MYVWTEGMDGAEAEASESVHSQSMYRYLSQHGTTRHGSQESSQSRKADAQKRVESLR